MKIKMKKVLCALFAIILVCAGLSACENRHVMQRLHILTVAVKCWI